MSFYWEGWLPSPPPVSDISILHSRRLALSTQSLRSLLTSVGAAFFLVHFSLLLLSAHVNIGTDLPGERMGRGRLPYRPLGRPIWHQAIGCGMAPADMDADGDRWARPGRAGGAGPWLYKRLMSCSICVHRLYKRLVSCSICVHRLYKRLHPRKSLIHFWNIENRKLNLLYISKNLKNANRNLLYIVFSFFNKNWAFPYVSIFQIAISYTFSKSTNIEIAISYTLSKSLILESQSLIHFFAVDAYS